MRAFAVAMILLGLMLGGIVWNYIYINEVSDALNDRLERLSEIGSEGCVAEAAELLVFWKRHVDTVGLSVEFIVVDRVSEQAKTLLTCAETGDRYGFAIARTLLGDAIEDMRRLERFEIGNIF